jgi:hypothetical protein
VYKNATWACSTDKLLYFTTSTPLYIAALLDDWYAVLLLLHLLL